MIETLRLDDLFESVEKRVKYDEYLHSHIANVKRAYDWLVANLPDVVAEDNCVGEPCYYGDLESIIVKHDASKKLSVPDASNYYDLKCEYDAYADYFYGERTPEVEQLFDLAWLSHIHQNPHHWQHWVHHSDDEGVKIHDMPYVFIIEMICDHWSFSWKSGNLFEIFDWYESHKEGMLLSEKTRNCYEGILEQIKQKLEELA